MTHPPNVMPEELQRAHYIKQIVDLEKLNAELLAACKVAQDFISTIEMDDSSGENECGNVCIELEAVIAKVEGKP